MADAPPVRLPRCRPSFWCRGSILFAGLHAAALAETARHFAMGDRELGIGLRLSIVFLTIEPSLDTDTLSLAVLLGLSLLGGLGLWAWRVRRPPDPIECHGEHVALDRGGLLRRRVRIVYHDVLSVVRLRWLWRDWLIVASRGRLPVRIPADTLADPLDAERLRSLLRVRLSALPAGAERVRRSDRAEVLARRLVRVAPATLALVLLLGGVFVWEVHTGADRRLWGLVPLGAFVPTLVREGDLHRLVTATLLHADWEHVRNNAMTLFVFGWVVERLLGVRAFLAVAVAGGVGGYGLVLLCVPWVPDAGILSDAVGSSGLVWGLVACFLWLSLRHRAEMPPYWRLPVLLWGFVAMELWLQLDMSAVTVLAHAGGALAGLAVTVLVVPGKTLTAPPRRPLVPLAAAAALVLGLGMLFGLRDLSGRGEARLVSLVDRVMRDPTSSADDANNGAWWTAIHPEATRDLLRTALDAAKRAVEEAPSPAHRDTLATVHYRLGNFERAVELERAVLAEERDPLYASQLARFEWARLHADGGRLDLPPDRLPAIRVELSPESEHRDVMVEIGETFRGGGELYALVVRQEDVFGLFHLRLGPAPESEHRLTSRVALRGVDPEEVTLRIVHVSLDATGLEPGGRRWNLWRMEPEVASWPRAALER